MFMLKSDFFTQVLGSRDVGGRVDPQKLYVYAKK